MTTLRVLLSTSLLGLSIVAGCRDHTPEGDVVSTGAPVSKAPPANVVGSFAIELPPTTLQPGDEQLPCWIFPLEITGPSRVVGGGKLTVGKGMHHGNITTRKKTGEGVRACPAEDNPGVIGGEAADVIGGGSVLFGSSTQISGEEWQSFPEGVGYRLAEGYEIVARMHYLDATSTPLTIAPRYEWYTIDETKLVHEVAPFAWVYQDFTIPPHSTLTVTSATCTFGTAMHVVQILPHMHRLGTHFGASFSGGPLDGKPFLDSRGYDPDNGVMTGYQPALDLSQNGVEGAGATFSCTWNNTLDKAVSWGIGDNEMCVLYGYAWPPSAAYSAYASDKGCFTVTP
jgi:hypothetical protein